ncbi:MAG: ArnT family glycosyltransferase [Tepidisphaeraceae bacterium]
MRWTRTDSALLCALLVFALCMRVPTVARPFERDPEGCGSFYGILARNYFRYDWRTTLGVPVQSMGVTPARPVYYANHPPGVPLLIAGVYATFGYRADSTWLPGEWQARLPTTLFTLGCVALIYLMLRTRASRRAAAFAALIFAGVPMTIVFGSQPDVINSQLVFFALLTVAAYLRFCGSQTAARAGVLCAALVPAALTDWPAFFLVVVLVGHFVLTQPRGKWWRIAPFAAVACLVFALLFAQVVAVKHDWGWIASLVSRRAMSNISDTHLHFGVRTWLREAIWLHAIGRHTLPVAMLTVAWVVMAARRWRADRATPLVGILLAWAALHVVVGRQGVFVHEWWWWPLTAGAAMASGVVVDRLCGFFESRSSNPRMVNVTAAAALLFLSGLNFQKSIEELGRPKRISRDEFNYSLAEFGRVIRKSSPPNCAVMLAEDDESLPLWYYADRPIKRKIWDPWTFEHRMSDGVCDLPFALTEPWSERPVALIVPRVYVSAKLQPLVEFADEQFERTDSPRFIVFDLRKKKAPR